MTGSRIRNSLATTATTCSPQHSPPPPSRPWHSTALSLHTLFSTPIPRLLQPECSRTPPRNTARLKGQYGAPQGIEQAPPAIPDYQQPDAPGDGYIWTPGYWAWTGDGYEWVQGAWVAAPYTGALWTPGYWGYGYNGYFWNAGYWGPYVGYYGGINYGFGYFGIGFYGGYWGGGHFWYNRRILPLPRRIRLRSPVQRLLRASRRSELRSKHRDRRQSRSRLHSLPRIDRRRQAPRASLRAQPVPATQLRPTAEPAPTVPLPTTTPTTLAAREPTTTAAITPAAMPEPATTADIAAQAAATQVRPTALRLAASLHPPAAASVAAAVAASTAVVVVEAAASTAAAVIAKQPAIKPKG